MKLVDVYEYPGAIQLLYSIMAERLKERDTNISHTKMPSHDEHVRFFASTPYLGWYFITNDLLQVLGVTYITNAREIGIYLSPQARGKGTGERALREIMRLHPGRHLANINPQNAGSRRLFQKLGFQLIQHTYATTEE